MSQAIPDLRGEWRLQNLPVPEPHVVGLAAGLILHLARPRHISGGPGRRTLGFTLLAFGISLAAWATRTAGTVDLDDPARLVTHGPYTVSRNPMYASWHLSYVGCALLVDTQWPLILLPGVSATIHREILREELRLEERFGAHYRAYVREVRRYL